MKKKRTAHPGSGNARTSGTSEIINNNTAQIVSAHDVFRKYAAAEMAVVSATDPADPHYRAIVELIVAALATTALMERQVA